MLESITLLGSSSGRNAGDAALMSGIMDSVDEACGRRLLYEIPTIKPRFVRATYRNNVVPISMLPWNLSLKMLGLPTYHSVMRTDLSLIFDAILFDRALYNPLFNFLSTLSLLLPKAKRAGKRMGFYNIGAGPVNTKRGQTMLRDLANLMDFITVRDIASYNILKDIGVTNPRMIIGADAALNVEKARAERVDEILAELGLESGAEILAININAYLNTWAQPQTKALSKDEFLGIYSAGLRRALKGLDVPVLFVSTQHHDVNITKELIARLGYPGKIAFISNVDYNHFEIKGVLSRVSLLFAMRLHAMILASSELTPIIGLSYQPKIDHYLSTIGLQGFALHFDSFSEHGIAEHIRRGWNARQTIRDTLSKFIPRQKQEALKAAQLVRSLYHGADLDQTIQAFHSSASMPQYAAK